MFVRKLHLFLPRRKIYTMSTNLHRKYLLTPSCLPFSCLNDNLLSNTEKLLLQPVFPQLVCRQLHNKRHQEGKIDDEMHTPSQELAKLGLVARFKKMYKEYWYVLMPAHLFTSAIWFGSFYYLSKSGFDIAGLLQSWSFNEALIRPFKDSSLGHVAVAYLLYKIATPARYTVTLGTTTYAIKYLVAWGFIKPVPSRAQLLQMYQDKKQNLQEKVADKKAELVDRKQSIMDDIEQFKEEFRTGFKTHSSTNSEDQLKAQSKTTKELDNAEKLKNCQTAKEKGKIRN